MTFDEFKASLSEKRPPEPMHPVLQGLWYQANGNWDRAHEIAQDEKNRNGDWLHAFLHRDEGDLGNAGYWYRRADKPMASGSIESEWEQLAKEFLA